MKKIIKISGMKCEGCKNRVINILSKVSEIDNVSVILESGTVSIEYSKNIDLDNIKEKIETLGFEVIDII